MIRTCSPPPGGVRRRAFSLVELVVVLAVLGILLSLAVPAGRRTRDEVAVRAARDALASAIARARLAAAAHAGADLVVLLPGGRVQVVGASGVALAKPFDLGAAYGVRVRVDGAAVDSVALHWDGLGIGRAAARTFRVQRGGAEARLSVALYGRARAW